MQKKRFKLTRKFKSISIILAAIVVFVTTYALILPAVSLEKDKAEEIGVFLQEESAALVSAEEIIDGQMSDPAIAATEESAEDLTSTELLEAPQTEGLEEVSADQLSDQNTELILEKETEEETADASAVLEAIKEEKLQGELVLSAKKRALFAAGATSGNGNAIHNPDGTVQTVPNPQGTTFELFNYFVSEDTKTTAGRDQWPGHIHDDNDFWMFNWYDLDGKYADSWGNGFNHDQYWQNTHLLGYGNNLGINKGHVFKFTPANAGTVIDGTKGTKSVDGDNGGLNSWTQDADPRQGIVQGTLVGGYPILTTNSTLGTDGSSLAYLFDGTEHYGKESKGNTNHLLYVDPDGYYTYDSRDYKAYYQPDGNFIVSDQPNTDDTELKGFWPFGDEIFWVGLHMNTQFSMPENGQVLNPKDALKDMQFEFSGDDDTWLYVDGVLVGDGGGIHNRTEIDINFATGKAIVTGLNDKVHTGTFYEEKWLDDIFKAAGKYNDADWEEIPGTGHKRFKAGTYHTFDMFYLERGGGESNLYIHYNLVSTDDFTGHKSYEGFADGERMTRDQFRFEMIGLDGQYQSVYDSATQTATVTKLNDDGHAIMPAKGTEYGAGTFEDPLKFRSESAYTDSLGNTFSGTVFEGGVLENGDIRFGSAYINAEEMLNCDQGVPSLYHYIIREIIPDDAVNADGVKWAEATEEQKAAGGFVKDQIMYDSTVYYMAARVTSWPQAGSDGNTYTAYGLSKTYYTDDTFTTVDPSVTFVDFRNRYAPDKGSVEFTKVDGANNPLPGAEFTLYNDSACTSIAKDLGNAEAGIAGVNQVKVSDENGKVCFENMAAPRVYYMKETQAPNGYEPNNTVHVVVIEDSKDTTKSSRIFVNGDAAETPVTKITNTKQGELSVIKEWRDENGRTVSGGDRTARVKLQRKHFANSAVPHKVTFTIQIQGRSDLVYTYTANNISGDVIIDWWDTNQQINSIVVKDAANQNKEYRQDSYWDGTNHKNRKLTITNVSSDLSVVVTYPSNVSWLFNSEHTPWMKNVSVQGSGAVYELQEDTAFNNSTDASHYAELAAPTWSKTWTLGTGKDFPTTDGTNSYLYYIVEVDDNGNELTIDQETELGYILKGYSANNATGIANQGTITVYNQVETPPAPAEINVVIKKTDDAENSTNYLEGAVFKLESREDESKSWTNVSNAQVEELDEISDFEVPKAGVKLTGITDGQYRLTEVTPPKGYVITNAYPVIFTVSGGAITSIEGTDSSVRYTAAITDASGQIATDAEFIIPNTPGKELPSTGGAGTFWFYLAGGVMVLAAGILLIARRLRA